MGKRLNEYEEAFRLANRVLDRPSADPDDDLAMLARQFLRAVERQSSLPGVVAMLKPFNLDAFPTVRAAKAAAELVGEFTPAGSGQEGGR